MLRNIFLYPIEALNVVKSNVWAVVLIVVGAALALHGKTDVGSSLLTGGFALLRSETAFKSASPEIPEEKKS